MAAAEPSIADDELVADPPAPASHWQGAEAESRPQGRKEPPRAAQALDLQPPFPRHGLLGLRALPLGRHRRRGPRRLFRRRAARRLRMAGAGPPAQHPDPRHRRQPDRQSRRHRRRVGHDLASFRLTCRTRSSPSRTAASARISASTRSALSARSSKNFFAGGVVEGGSTLTQQLAKNMFLTPERSLKRKVQEVVLSRLAGDEILQGRDPRDVPEPGLFRFGRLWHRRRRHDATSTVDASELTLPQAAMLAGVLPAPSRYAPNRNPEAAHQRAALVLAAMTRERLHLRRRGEECARQSRARPRRYHMSRSEQLHRRLGDGRAALPSRHGRAGRGGGDDRRPEPAGRRPSKRSPRRSTRRARNSASAKARWSSSTAPARCAPWWAAAPMPRASSTAPSKRAASRARPSSRSSI